MLISLWRSSRAQRTGDAVLALLLAGWSLGAVLTGDPSWGTPKGLAVLLALASTVPVAWRSRYPLSTAALVLVANGGCIFEAVPHEAAFQPFVALALAAYSAGSRAEGRRADWVPPALVIAALPLFIAAVQHGQSGGNAFPSLLWLVAAWAVGRTVRSWRHQNEALARANQELAAQRARQEEAAVAVERGRIARELHDVIAHNVAMMVVQAGAATRVLDGEHPQVRAALDVIATTGRQTVDEMRTVLGVLRAAQPAAGREPQPGLHDLSQLVASVEQAGLPVRLRVEGDPLPLPQAVDLSAFRIVQEALTNAVKHAGPARATVTVSYRGDALELDVEDDGAGRGGGTGTGNGLVGMRERAVMLGGQLEAARTGHGFRVHARLPLGGAG